MKEKLLPVLTLLAAMASIQYGASVAKNLFPLAGVAGASTLRLFFAAVILCGLFQPWKETIPKNSRKFLFLYGCSLGLMNLAFYYSLARIPLGIAVALEFTGPLAVAVFSGKTKLDFLWAILAALGIFMLLPTGNSETGLDPLGMGLALLAGFFWALYIVFGKKLAESIRPRVAASAGMALAALVVIPWGLTLDTTAIFQSAALPMGLFVGLFSSAIPYSLEMSAMKKMPSQTFSVLMSMEPAMASLIGLVFLNEALGPLQWMAVSCIILASQGSAFTPKKRL